MGLGREVADAYISVHGDLSDFRKDLEKAGPMTEKLAQKNAMDFADAWGKRIEADVNGKWASIVDTMYSDKALDWDRLVGKFDANGNIDEAEKKIRSFMAEMQDAGKMQADEWIKADDALKGMMGSLRERRKLEQGRQDEIADSIRLNQAMIDGEKAAGRIRTRLYEEATRENEAWGHRRKQTMEDAIAENERWGRTFEGMSKNTAIKDLNEDFKKLTEAMGKGDMHAFAKTFDEDWTALRTRVMAVTDAMVQQNRLTQENRKKIHDAIDEHIHMEEDLRHATARTTSEVAFAKIAQDRYNKSLEGMIESSHVARLERDFRNLAQAIDSGNWDTIAKGHRDMDSMRFAVANTATEMRRLGRITDESFGRVMATMGSMDRNFTTATRGARNLGTSLDRNNTFLTIFRRGLDNIVAKFRGLSGFNVVGDVFRDGSNFIQNLDRNADKIARMTTAVGGLVSVIGSSLGGLATIGNDIAKAAAGLTILAPGFLVGAGIGIGVMVTAFKDMKTVLKDLGPQFTRLQDSISAKFWKEAEKPIRNLTEKLFPTLEKQLGNTATMMGSLTGAFADAFSGAATPERVTVMFERMNDAIGTLRAAMAPLARAFVNLGDVGSKYFGRFAKWLVDISERFDRFIQKAFDNGDLDKWVERGIQGLKDLGRVVYDTSRAFGAISDAARAAGSKGLHGFADNMERIADFMNSPRFQKALTGVFEGFYATLNGIEKGMAALGRGLEAFIPSFQRISGSLGQIFETVGLYLEKFLKNKTLQEGVERFVAGINTALNNLSPAIEPMANSLGQLFSLMGEVLENVSIIVSKIVVTLGPTFDKMLEAIKPLIKPVTDLALQLIDKLGPIFEKFVDEVLPPLVDLFIELLPWIKGLVDLLTPAFNVILDQAGKFFKNMADALKDFNVEAGPFLKKLGEISDKAGKVKVPEMFDGNFGAQLAYKWGVAFASAEPAIAGVVGTFIENQTRGIRTALKTGLDIGKLIGEVFNPTTMPGTLAVIAGHMQQWGVGILISIADGFEGMVEDVKIIFQTLYNNIKTEFQNFMRSLLGLPAAHKNDAKVTIGSGGGGAGGKGMGASGKLDPAMLGMGEPEGMFDQLILDVQEQLGNFFGSIGANIESFGAGVKVNWDNFWTGLGTKIQEVWDGAVLWIQTKAEEIRLNIETWAAGIKLNWDTFWTEVGTTISTKWTEFWTTVQTKAAEIKLGIETWAGEVKTNWDTFWTELGTTISTKWSEFWTTVSTKANEIKTGISNFGTDVKNNWNGFWGEVGTKVTTAWTGIKSGVDTGVKEVITFFTTMPGKITAAFFGMFSKMSKIGENIASGLKTGIENGQKWVTDAASRIASAAVAAAKLALEVNSPSKAFRRLGLSGGEGLAQGFDWSETTVAAASAAMANHAADALTEQFAKSKMFAAGASAALGLTEGLKSGAPGVASAFGNLIPSTATVGIGGAGAGAAVPTKIINIENVTSTVTTPTKSPGLVASKVIDDLASAFSTL